ncbi:MAG: beta-ketoacyl-[acyl-carrier-protein] synthase family protein [Tannerella sp.]|jgi:3-oxoacyl-[acyl-carrier-protein] synthase-1|nr:beta-ketoacyl-[acyl-carrier-protein] synthase family protein [Tannerella sp.]
MNNDEIYVTGAGVVSAIGMGKAATLDALINQRTGVAPIRYLRTSHTDIPVGEVKYSNDELREMLQIPPSEAFIRSSLLAIPAVREALTQARLDDRSPLRVAFLSGITVGGMDQAEQMYSDFLENDSKNSYIELNDCGACTEQIAGFIGGFRMVSTVVTACSSSANTIMMGVDMLRSGRADVVVAGGTECLSRYHVNGFNTLMILDREMCKPFDRDRAGINLGEGAGYLTLEPAESAVRRGVAPIGRIAGYCNVCDAYHPTASSPDGLGPYLAMKGAIENAGLKPEDIDYINAHGTGTPNNDLTEGLAAMKLFGDSVPPLSSLKAYTGHTTSAAGSFEAVVSLLAIERNFLPANMNFRNRIAEHNFVPVTDSAPSRPVRRVLSNSFGFGGNDSAIVLSGV